MAFDNSLSTASFESIVEMFQRESGIRLRPEKRAMISGRLRALAQQWRAASLDAYVHAVVTQRSDVWELKNIVDKLTTNETYFFREPEHFDFLSGLLRNRETTSLTRVWSAASSTGEEAYSIAMLMYNELRHENWEVIGTDLSASVVATARRALYPLTRLNKIPPGFLRRYCMKGEGEYQGQLLIGSRLREKVRFLEANLNEPLPDLGGFDVIFLRNVLIYFEPQAKLEIIRRVASHLRPNGFLFLGHAESVNCAEIGLKLVRPAVYVRP